VKHERFDKLTEGSEARKASTTGTITRLGMLRLLGGAIAGAALASIPMIGCAEQKPTGEVDTPQLSQEPTPQWEQVFQEALGDSAMGYYYMVARDGQVVSEGGQHFVRSPHEQRNPGTMWTSDSRINLASVPKVVTAVAYLSLHQAGVLPLTDYFYYQPP
jgi:CubicO group peptidase (beta-lactamase class C family)